MAIKRQDVMALLTMEAKYISRGKGTQQAMWNHNFLDKVGHAPPLPSNLLIDNRSAIAIAKNPLEDTFSLLGMSEEGSIHCLLVEYAKDAHYGTAQNTSAGEDGTGAPVQIYSWSKEVKELSTKSMLLRPNLGPHATRESREVDISDLYQCRYIPL